MYTTLLIIHSLLRWILLVSLITAMSKAFGGWFRKRSFSKNDDLLRTLTASFAHLQLLIGIWLYFVSPIIGYFRQNFKEAVRQSDIRFFGLEHSLLMIAAVVVITIGSIAAKRKTDDLARFKTLAIWFSIGLLLLLLAIPWPFSPFAARPFIRF